LFAEWISDMSPTLSKLSKSQKQFFFAQKMSEILHKILPCEAIEFEEKIILRFTDLYIILWKLEGFSMSDLHMDDVTNLPRDLMLLCGRSSG
jgi:hypothetical protein